MNETDDEAPGIEEETPHFPALEIDYDLYMKMLEESEWDDDQKREFIETIASIVVSFVDLGFGIHPVQQVLDNVDTSQKVMTAAKAHMVDSGEHPDSRLTVSVGDETRTHAERSNHDKYQ